VQITIKLVESWNQTASFSLLIVFHDFRAKIKNIEATEEAKQKLVQERMRKRDNEVSAFVPTNMAANYIQHNRCMYDFYKEGRE